MTQKISAIIPAFNEDEDIIELIAALQQAHEIEEVIVVDDFSEEHYATIYRNIPNITLIRHGVNKGKSAALHTGIAAAKSDYILVLDADLIGITPTHIKQLAQIMHDYDILCLVRGGDTAFGKFVGSTYITRGEHLVQKTCIKKFEKLFFDGTRWGFDNNINDLLTSHQVRFAFVEMVNVTHKLKSKKYPFWKGVMLDLNMFYLVVIRKYKLFSWIITYIRLAPYIRNRIRIGEKSD